MLLDIVFYDLHSFVNYCSFGDFNYLQMKNKLGDNSKCGDSNEELLCRCCLSTKSRMESVSKFVTLFADLAGINVCESDGLPQWMCLECCILLQKAVRFKQKVLHADTVLRDYVAKHYNCPSRASEEDWLQYAAPSMCETSTLSFEYDGIGKRRKVGFYDVLEHKKQIFNTDREKIESNVLTKPIVPSVHHIATTHPSLDDTGAFEEGSEHDVEDLEPYNTDGDNGEKDSVHNTEGGNDSKVTDDEMAVLPGKNSKSVHHREPLQRYRRPWGLPCDVCGECYLGEWSLIMHKRLAHHMFVVRVSAECTACGVVFDNAGALRRHRELRESCADAARRSCIYCGESFSSEEHLARHVRQHRENHELINCPVCNPARRSPPPSRARRTRTHAGKVVVCEICGKECDSRRLVYHQRMHSGEKPYHCDLCPKRFSMKHALNKHRRVHTGERPYKCSKCPAAFKDPSGVYVHMRIHTGVKPYKCSVCDKSFRQSHTHKSHVRAVHMALTHAPHAQPRPPPARTRRVAGTVPQARSLDRPSMIVHRQTDKAGGDGHHNIDDDGD